MAIGLCLLIPVGAGADDLFLQDADDSSGRLDINTVAVSHPEYRTIRFVITFYETHDLHETNFNDTLDVDLRLDGQRPWRFKDVLVLRNPDGGLYGILRSHKGEALSYVRVWRPDEFSIAIDFKQEQLKSKRLARRADWLVEVGYADASEICAEDGGHHPPSSCFDTAPDGGYHRHLLDP